MRSPTASEIRLHTTLAAASRPAAPMPSVLTAGIVAEPSVSRIQPIR
jgi:hypothetical protein